MSMRWDPLLARAVARELDEALRGRRVRALLLEGESRRVVLYLREATLVAELHPRAGWISLMDAAEPVALARPLPCRVLGVEALPDESAIRLDLQRIRGKDEGVELVLEFAAGRGNAIVVGHRSRQVRHVLIPRETGGRALVPGAPWSPLPTGGRRGGPGGPPLSEAEFRELAAEGRGAVLKGVAWASSMNVEALLAPPPAGWAFFLEMRHPEHWGAWLTPSPKGRILYPLRLDEAGAEAGSGAEAEPVPSLLEGMRRLRSEGEHVPAGALLLPAALVARGEDLLRRLERKAAALRRQLEGAPDPAPLRAVGDLLLARYGEVPTGQASVELVDFDGEAVDVALDPALQVHENARRYYDEAARAERARSELPAKVAKAAEAAAELAALLERVGGGEAEPAELEARVGPDPAGGSADGGPGARGGKGGRGGKPQGASLPYRSFRSSGGLEIRVGRGARKNDDLTFHHAAPDDVWLHVREVPGAHVVLRWRESGNPPARDLEEAAGLAALNSEARHSGMVPVDWTRRKYVRKPRKAPPGAVLPDRVQTVFVEPDPGLPERLTPPES
jgi:predicted ribosome quality control (RQC) complex YloA/Tae2 family protein